MKTLAITLKEEHRQFVEEAIKSGRYVSEAELVADAIAELKAREELHSARLAELRAAVQLGLNQLDRGEGREWNLESIKAKGRERYGNSLQ
jgi:antitoxin ParD1/3/4